MRNLSLSLIYIGFFALIGYVCYITSSAIPLWALLLMPSIKIKGGNIES